MARYQRSEGIRRYSKRQRFDLQLFVSLPYSQALYQTPPRRQRLDAHTALEPGSMEILENEAGRGAFGHIEEHLAAEAGGNHSCAVPDRRAGFGQGAGTTIVARIALRR